MESVGAPEPKLAKAPTAALENSKLVAEAWSLLNCHYVFFCMEKVTYIRSYAKRKSMGLTVINPASQYGFPLVKAEFRMLAKVAGVTYPVL